MEGMLMMGGSTGNEQVQVLMCVYSEDNGKQTNQVSVGQ